MNFCLRFTAASLFIAAMLSATAISAQAIHKSVDAQGHTLFSDQPPPATAPSPALRRNSVVNANEASRRLTQMQQTRRLGMTPLPGESVQSADGTVVNPRYWRRQEGLRLAVEQAQRRSNQTQQLLLAHQ